MNPVNADRDVFRISRSTTPAESVMPVRVAITVAERRSGPRPMNE